MKFNTLFISLLLNFSLVFAQNTEFNAKAFSLGKSHFCKDVKVKRDDKLYYAALAPELMEGETSNCNKYVVAMIADPHSKGKYKYVKAIIKDVCLECKVDEIRLSSKSIIDISGRRKGTVFWGILSDKGEFINGPFSPAISDKDSKNLLKISGEKKLSDIIGKFIIKAKELAKSKKNHLKEFPWETKITPVKGKKVIKSTIVKKVTVTSVKKVKVVKTVSRSTVINPRPSTSPNDIPTEKPNTNTIDIEENDDSAKASTGIVTGAVAISIAAGALLLVHRRSSRKNYIFGEPLDQYDRSLDKELVAKTKDGKQIKLKIPYHDFNDIAHIQIFSPAKENATEPNIDIFNVYQERAMMSENTSFDSLPQPQEQPKPHIQLPIPSNSDFMTMFSPVESIVHPDIAACPKENIGAYDPTGVTTRINDDPYLSQYKADDSKEIYNSVPKVMNQTYANNCNESSTDDILLDYVEGEDYYN